jgi:hypothetical protein
MNRKLIFHLRWFGLLPALLAAAGAQDASPQEPLQPPVSYASVSQLNTVLSQLEDASKSAQGDLSKLRIERWKTDSGNKRQTQANVDSVQRNLQNALPAIITELRASPESLPSTFKLYRNLDALYDVFSSLVESTGAFGSRDEFQSLDNDLSAIEKSRRSLAGRMEALAGAKEAELARLRAALKNAQTAATPVEPKKIVVDDTEPAKKPVKKKSAAKPAAKTVTPAPAPATAPPTKPTNQL